MRKLLSTDFFRLWREKMFWLATAAVTAGSALFAWMTYNTSKGYDDIVYTAEDLLFNLLPAFGFVCAFVLSFWLGAEFDDHTIRNRLIVGHTRTGVYFSKFLTALSACIIMLFAMLAVSGVMGYLFFGKHMLGWTELAFIALCCVLMAAVFSAIFVGIGMNVNGRAAAITVSVLLMFAMALLASFCINALMEEPTSYSYVTITMDGVEFGELQDNPAYVSGFKRTVYELIADLLPTGQAIQLHNNSYDRMLRWPLLSLIMLAVTTAAGYLPFRIRDIK